MGTGEHEISISVVTAEGSLELLERSKFFAVLARWLDEAARGVGRVVLLGGEAGVGKTALLRRFCADHSEAEVYWGACEWLFTPRALGPVVDIAESTAGDLGRLVERGAAPHEFVRALVAQLGVRRPVVVVIEEAHWADEGTFDAIKLLARRVVELPAVLLVSFREEELSALDPLRVLLGKLAGANRVERTRLPALSRDAVRELARPLEVDEDQLFARTGGNPFFVTEVLAAGGVDIPDAVRDAVLARAARLGRATRRLLDAAAVVPAHAELWLLEAIAPTEVGYLDECASSGMLAVDGRFVGFRHELARADIDDAITPYRRVALHWSVLRVLSSAAHGAVDPARLATARSPHSGSTCRWISSSRRSARQNTPRRSRPRPKE